jgi:hypothetical protein
MPDCVKLVRTFSRIDPEPTEVGTQSWPTHLLRVTDLAAFALPSEQWLRRRRRSEFFQLDFGPATSRHLESWTGIEGGSYLGSGRLEAAG